MEIRADGVAEPAAFEAGRPVVPEAGHDPAERHRPFSEDRPAGVILEAHDRLPVSGVELALDQHVADETPVSGHRVHGEDSGAGLLRARLVAVVAAKQLVAAADGEHDGVACHRVGQSRGAGGQIRRDERLLAVLAPSDVDEVGVGREVVAQADLAHVEIDAASLSSPGQHREIAAVGVDVEVVRIQMREDDLSCDALPVRPRVAAVGDHALEAQHRRVGREEHELAAGLGQLEPPIQRRVQLGNDLDSRLVQAAV